MKELTDEQFHTALHHEDELGSVIRAHLHIENAIDKLLEKQIPAVDRLKEIELSYKEKVILCLAMGLNEEFKSSLLSVGEIRNKFAHRPQFELTKQDTNNLYNSFAAPEKELIQQSLIETNKTTNENFKFKSLTPRDQFIIMIVALRQILLVALTKW